MCSISRMLPVLLFAGIASALRMPRGSIVNAVAEPAAWAAARRKSRRFFEVMLPLIVREETVRDGIHAGAWSLTGQNSIDGVNHGWCENDGIGCAGAAGGCGWCLRGRGLRCLKRGAGGRRGLRGRGVECRREGGLLLALCLLLLILFSRRLHRRVVTACRGGDRCRDDGEHPVQSLALRAMCCFVQSGHRHPPAPCLRDA